MVAKNKKNQVNFKRSIKWLERYNELNCIREIIEDEDSKEWRRANRKYERAFDKYLEYVEELPKYERKRIEESELY